MKELTGLGFTLPSESVQPALDALSSKLNDELPLGIKADSVEVTDDGVVTKFSTQNATIPAGGRRPLLSNRSDGQPVGSFGSFHRKLLTYLPMSMASWRLTPDGWPGPSSRVNS